MSAPMSELLKNLLLLFPASKEDPTLPLAEISNTSALLKTFLIEERSFKSDTKLLNC